MTSDTFAASVCIRRFADDDAEAVCVLMGQLGYTVPVAEVAVRVRQIRMAGGEELVAVTAGGAVVGCVQAAREQRLAEGEFAELVSLVVHESCRSAGVGAMLVTAVEGWAREQGLVRLRVRSNNKREGAIRFYARAGFIQRKEQAVLEKGL
ncbi:GNAT family N-acetyltransferase [Maridesulfovibrio sp. FT414]|uniref:GNAT family N-acetyltransferase n=1 Tax=Maridesulfovibrio sp. FT414 TaxID=2979469 RepID=UPI003D80A318